MAGHDTYTRLRYERKEVYLCDAFLEGTWIDVMSHLDYDKRVYK